MPELFRPPAPSSADDDIFDVPDHWAPKYVREWTLTQTELMRGVMEIVNSNTEAETKVQRMGLGSVPWLPLKVHTDAMERMFVENPTGLNHPTTGGPIEGDERETRLIMARYYYQLLLSEELGRAKDAGARAVLTANMPQSVIGPPPGARR